MRTLVRDLLRQRFRTLLTVVGVAVGIFTLVVFGAVGEQFRATLDGAKVFAGGLIGLVTKTNKEGINPGITEEALAKVRANPGVAAVGPTLVIWFDGFDLQADPLAFMVPKPLLKGLPAAYAEALHGHGLPLLEGRWLQAGDERHAMVIDWLAQRRGLKVGGAVTIRSQEYEVVGIYHGPDTPFVPAGLVPYDPINDDFIKPRIERAAKYFQTMSAKNPFLAGMALQIAKARGKAQGKSVDELARDFARKQASLFRIYEIVPKDRSAAGTSALAKELRGALPDLAIIDPATVRKRMEQTFAIFMVITLIVTVVSTVVGGLMIVNTMAMAVIERRREIGIKVALGATPGQIALEFVVEAALLALFGAVLGIALALLTIAIFEPWLLSQIETGAQLFRVTPRLVAFSTLYALLVGVLAGGVPAARAARIDPAVTLREL